EDVWRTEHMRWQKPSRLNTPPRPPGEGRCDGATSAGLRKAPYIDGCTAGKANLIGEGDFTWAALPDPAGSDNGRVGDLPLLLDLTGRRVVVVGGGNVATRRVRALHEAGAEVLVVAPRIADEIRELDVQLAERRFTGTDLDGAWLAM